MERGEVRELLWQLEHARKQYLQPYFLKIGLTLGQGQPRILKTLKKEWAMTQKELADRCSLDATTMSRVIDRLEEAGLLKRTANPGCRRSHRICLTREGEIKAEQVEMGFAQTDDCLWQDFSQEEMEKTAESLRKLLRNLQKGIEGRQDGEGPA